MSIADTIAPETLAQKSIALELATDVPRVGSVVLVSVDYSATEPEGVVFPLLYSVTRPDGSKLIPPRTIDLLRPQTLAFQPDVSGRHFVRIGEAFHDRAWGGLVVEVQGDQAPGTR